MRSQSFCVLISRYERRFGRLHEVLAVSGSEQKEMATHSVSDIEEDSIHLYVKISLF